MKYILYATQAQAQAHIDTINTSMGLPKYGTNAATGELDVTAGMTTNWAIPQQVATGDWVFPSPDDTGLDWDSSWNINNENGE